MSLKSELKNGAVVACRNGEKFIKIDNTLISIDDVGYMPLDRYLDDLTYVGDKNWSIVKINNNTENGRGYCSQAICEVYKRNEWTWERPKEILDKVEREYLSAIIKPFKDKVEGITKYMYLEGDYEFIVIQVKNNSPLTLPRFKPKTMYKGMVTYKFYTLEELGL